MFSSDVSIELPFTLMHPKPLEEFDFRDGKSMLFYIGSIMPTYNFNITFQK